MFLMDWIKLSLFNNYNPERKEQMELNSFPNASMGRCSATLVATAW